MIEESDYLPSFAYTIGLWKNYKHPELISFGLTLNTLHLILNDAGDMIKGGQMISFDKIYDNFFENSSTRFLNVDKRNIGDYFGYGISYYKNENFPAMQLIWTDRNNKFPWEEDFEEEFNFKQPLLDRNAEFKFREEKNLGVFTTRQFLDLKKKILRVVHDHNGDWQFLTGDQFLKDIRLICLEDMINADGTLNEVFNLEYGEVAERKSIGGEWIRKTFNEDE